MPIDPRMVKWDEAPAQSGPAPKIDPRLIKWEDDKPKLSDLREFGMAKVNGYDGTDSLAGWVRGAGSIGATLLRPFESSASNEQRRKSMDEALAGFGADPSSTQFRTNKLLAEFAGTAGIPGAVAKGAALIPGVARALPTLLPAIESGGMTANGAKGVYGMANRVAGGAVAGGLTAGAVDPQYAGTGMLFGGATPLVVRGFGAAGEVAADAVEKASRRLMQSAIKPTIAQLRSGDAAVAADVLLRHGLNPNAKGVEKLGALIDDIDGQITSTIANSPATINKGNVVDAAWPTRQKFAKQVDPTSDLNAIDNVVERFYLNPSVPNNMPVQTAQELKQGTYRVLSKKYGQMGSAETEAQKALARGLKDEIAAAVPEVSQYNAELSRLIRAKEVAERRALMEQNKNPLGLAALAPTKAGLLTFMADKSAMAKSLLARGLNSTAPIGRSAGLLDDPALLPYLRGGLLLETNQGSRQ